MSQPVKSDNSTLPRDPYPPYRPIYSWVFQIWLILFLAVLCIALIFYLYPYAQKLFQSITG